MKKLIPLHLFSYPTKLEKRLKYKFKNRSLLDQALSHKSYIEKDGENNERLEYLGDAVLGLVLGDLLMKINHQATEGDLSKMRSSMVSTEGLYKKSLEIGLSRDLKMSVAEKINQGNRKPRLLASALEAVIGAIYLEAGFKTVFRVIQDLFQENLHQTWEDQDYKTILQSKVQKLQNQNLEYRLIKEVGPPHRKTFFVRTVINGKILGRGKGFTKKDAEKQAAFHTLENFHQHLEKSLQDKK